MRSGFKGVTEIGMRMGTALVLACTYRSTRAQGAGRHWEGCGDCPHQEFEYKDGMEHFHYKSGPHDTLDVFGEARRQGIKLEEQEDEHWLFQTPKTFVDKAKKWGRVLGVDDGMVHELWGVKGFEDPKLRDVIASLPPPLPHKRSKYFSDTVKMAKDKLSSLRSDGGSAGDIATAEDDLAVELLRTELKRLRLTGGLPGQCDGEHPNPMPGRVVMDEADLDLH